MGTGIKIEEAETRPPPRVRRFSILSGQEVTAANYLVDLLDRVVGVNLANDEDEEGEGMTSIRRTSDVFEIRKGGHGWQGPWTPIPRDELVSMIASLAPYNGGGHVSQHGSIETKHPSGER